MRPNSPPAHQSGVDLLKALEGEIDALSVDEIRERLSPIFAGMWTQSPIFDPGSFVYRARIIDAAFNSSLPMTLADLKYPPASLAKLGRANRDGSPMFYCSMSKEPIFFELAALRVGDELIVSSWKTKAKMFVNNIGYTKTVFDEFGAKRECPTWMDTGNGKSSVEMPAGGAELLAEIRPADENDVLRIELSRLFMRTANEGAAKQYKLTAAIAEAHLGTINETENFAGILYPSVRMWANGDNLALTPAFVDEQLEFRRATRVRIDKVNPTGFDVTSIDCAREFDDWGDLRWLGRVLTWQVPPHSTALAKVTLGRDNDGEYSTGKDGSPCHWILTNAVTGEEIQAC